MKNPLSDRVRKGDTDRGTSREWTRWHSQNKQEKKGPAEASRARNLISVLL